MTKLANYIEYYTGNSEYHVPELMRSSILNLTLDDRKVIDTRTCHAPIMPGSHSTRCCIGAVLAGAIQKVRPDSRKCPQDSATYDRLQALAIQELEESPVAPPEESLLRCRHHRSHTGDCPLLATQSKCSCSVASSVNCTAGASDCPILRRTYQTQNPLIDGGTGSNTNLAFPYISPHGW
jgi:hypothetical protein